MTTDRSCPPALLNCTGNIRPGCTGPSGASRASTDLASGPDALQVMARHPEPGVQ